MLEDPRTADRLMQEAQTAESIARNPVADPDAAPPVIVLPDDWEIDPELEFEGSASTHPSGGPSANDKVNMCDGTGEQARISEAHSSTDEEIDFSSFSRVEDALFRSGTVDRREAFQICISLPTDDFLLFGYRDGHAPIDDHCNFCGQPIPSVVIFPPDADNSAKKELIATHVNSCAAMLAMYIAEDDLLRKYPATTPAHPLKGQAASKSTRARNGAPPKNTSIAMHILWKRVSDALSVARLSNKDPRTCKLPGCDNQPLYNMDYARYHFVTRHGFFLTLARPNGIAHDVEDRGFRPTYYITDARYHCDPIETHRFASKLIETRITGPCQDVAAYGLRQDIEVDQGVLSDDANGELPDGKYRLIAGKKSSIARDGLCIVCVNDHCLSPATRAYPYNTTSRQLNQHHVICIRLALKAIKEAELAHAAGIVLKHATYLWEGGRIICPDPVCRRNARQFDSKCDWLSHLVAVHYVHVRGPNVNRLHRIVKLSELTFDDEAELEAWAGVTSGDAVDDGSKSDGGVAVEGQSEKTSATGKKKVLGKRRKLEEEEEEEEAEDGEKEDGEDGNEGADAGGDEVEMANVGTSSTRGSKRGRV